MDVVSVIENHEPFPVLLIRQPVEYQSKYIGFRVVTSRQSQLVCHIAICIFKPRLCVGMYPKYIRARGLLSESVRKLNS
jgi:hypothetical protein